MKRDEIYLCEVAPKNLHGGWVSITLAPGKKTPLWDRDLDQDLYHLLELGVTNLVPLLEDHEFDMLKIPNLVGDARKYLMSVHRFPIPDGGVPDLDDAHDFITSLIELYKIGERICIHCNGGLGRAGTIAACLRLTLGIDKDPASAIFMVRAIRGDRAIETIAQEKFIEQYWFKFIKGEKR